jgi:structural maintenance of chromosome 2
MFNNANVIYRTKFVDGVSAVTRTIGIGSSRTRALADADNAEDSAGTSSSKTASTSRGSRRKGKENSVA